ncbi:Cyclin-dependent kinase 7 [Ceratobasidium theobromae]|uniref:[RNA-polymerase]-subunit kinase n=1 Tax=Ceratobasidium theobromae TaxID=1582974 RepID=A0A5N5QSU8_9AGAM|nr:Cyclin-dependent kinase 7 [Ceratobasidium theobromae]
MDVVGLEKTNSLTAKKWTKEMKIGEGTYAVVYKGREAATGRRIAIKKIKVGQMKEGLDQSAIREVRYLRELRHPNVIELLDVFSTKTNLNLVLEFLETDLEAVIKDRSNVFLPADIKSWMAMTLRGLEYCHRNWVLHRVRLIRFKRLVQLKRMQDLKPNNLLIAADGELKIADFGLARDFTDPAQKMTCQVITRWYRPPELLYGARYYSTGVDMWSVGCIFAELMLRTPYLPGESDMDQLKTIFRALGTPTEEDWPGHASLPDYTSFGQFPKSPLKLLFSAASTEALDLLGKFLIYDPRKRISAYDALHHSYFFAAPYPTHPSRLPKASTPLAPRPLPPDEANDADGLKDGPLANKKSGTKRKASGNHEERERSVSRKLVFT